MGTLQIEIKEDRADSYDDPPLTSRTELKQIFTHAPSSPDQMEAAAAEGTNYVLGNQMEAAAAEGTNYLLGNLPGGDGTVEHLPGTELAVGQDKGDPQLDEDAEDKTPCCDFSIKAVLAIAGMLLATQVLSCATECLDLCG